MNCLFRDSSLRLIKSVFTNHKTFLFLNLETNCIDRKLSFYNIFISTCLIVIVVNISYQQTNKRKVRDETRSSNEKWKLDYFFTLVRDKAVCLLCSDSVFVLKEYNIKRHYETKHGTNYKNIQGQMRKDKLNQLEKC